MHLSPIEVAQVFLEALSSTAQNCLRGGVVSNILNGAAAASTLIPLQIIHPYDDDVCCVALKRRNEQ